MAKILLVEDDLHLSTTVSDHLEFEHHNVESVANGRDALHLLKCYSFDLIILDWMLPDLSGIEILKNFRSTGGTTPVLMLTGKRDVAEKEEGLDSGADDYLTKPFQTRELTARVRALLRRPTELQADVLRFDTIELDVRSFRVTRDGQNVPLAAKEFAVLEFFMRHPGQAFSAEAILERVWKSDEVGSLDGVRACIKRIREKMDAGGQPSYIRSAHGFGYKLDHLD